ncbi:endo-1,4-beta-xylanase [Xylanimonas ulmi]|uniref:Beta-xylanase n=1 Tax=Xylanimonas ulmi TaxID=228973 RepID=A0A4Q7M7Q2_9MICO|nr:endo-1,4-beta-xylanase [Xylanibacterium ulmi]RZS62149.1 GH35 family endo-1,4-beta-xylanase [Xylanibacterium ulmi]
MSNVAALTSDTRFAHRRTRATVTLTDADGQPLGGREVTVEQTKHAFLFGNIGFDFIGLANGEPETPLYSPFGGCSVETARRLEPLWLDLFNQATLPFYWRGFELEAGRPDTRRLRRTAEWFAARGVAVKGHPLLWHTMAPRWLLGEDDKEVARDLRARIEREVTHLGDVVPTWDAINEAVIMPVFDREDNAVTRLAQRLGRVPMVRLAFDAARRANPDVTLLINDFNLSPAYERLIEDVLAAGVRLDAIGLQSHMHQGYRGEAFFDDVLARFARFGLPLHLTENTLLSGDPMPAQVTDLNDYVVDHWPSTPKGEERQAEQIVRHYQQLVAHPAVACVNYWGITDEGAWLGAPSGLVRADGSPKPAYDALRGLIKGAWWLRPTTARTDALGRVVVDAFAGDYRLTVADAVVDLTLPTGDPALTVSAGGDLEGTRS